MNAIAGQKCHNHGEREAAALCPECRRPFCRECVTEHDDRMICAACLRKLSASAEARKARTAHLLNVAKAVAAFIVLWLTFYVGGRVLLRIPSTFHEGNLWKHTPAQCSDPARHATGGS